MSWLKRIFGLGLEGLWRTAMGAAADLDLAAADEIAPDYYKTVDIKLRVHLCGLEKLKELSDHDWMFASTDADENYNVFLLAGPLPNGNQYFPCWAGGHELHHLVLRQLGLPWGQADHMCEGR